MPTAKNPKWRWKGTPQALKEDLRCQNSECELAFISCRKFKNIRKGSPYGSQKKPRWLCSKCKHPFSDTLIRSKKKNYFKKKPLETEQAKDLKILGWTIRAIAAKLKVSKSSVFNWVSPKRKP